METLYVVELLDIEGYWEEYLAFSSEEKAIDKALLYKESGEEYVRVVKYDTLYEFSDGAEYWKK